METKELGWGPKPESPKRFQRERSEGAGCTNRPDDCVESAATAAQRLRSTAKPPAAFVIDSSRRQSKETGIASEQPFQAEKACKIR
jgi:hypothetical protein